MARGTPDYGIEAPSSYVYPITSYEDYFMRQGLIETLDGKGDIILFDSLETGMSNWYQTIGAGANLMSLSPEHARGGGWSLKFATTGLAGAKTEGAMTIPVAQPNRFGMECNFIMRGNDYRPAVSLYYYDSAHYYQFAVRYSATTNKLQYHSPLDNWDDIATFDWEVSPIFYFHPVKLVIDATKLEYVKFICRDIEYDLTGKTTTVENLASRRSLQPKYSYQFLAGALYHSWLDDIIITTNEP